MDSRTDAVDPGSDEAEFKAFCRRALSTVPPPVLARLALLQPFAIADAKSQSGLSVLQDFSNLDKHRALVLPRPIALALTISAQLRYADEADAERFGERPMHVEPDLSAGLVEDSEVVRIPAGAELLEASGDMDVQVEPYTRLGTGPVVHLRLALEAVLRAADDALRVIAGGLVTADDPRADRSWGQPLHLEPLQGPALDDWKSLSPEESSGAPRDGS